MTVIMLDALTVRRYFSSRETRNRNNYNVVILIYTVSFMAGRLLYDQNKQQLKNQCSREVTGEVGTGSLCCCGVKPEMKMSPTGSQGLKSIILLINYVLSFLTSQDSFLHSQ